MNSQYPFNYQELPSMIVRGIHSTQVVEKSQHAVGLRDLTATIPLLNNFGKQSSMLNSQIVYALTACMPLPRASIHSVRGTHSTHVIDQSQHPIGLGGFTASIPLLNKIGNQSILLISYLVYEFTASIPLPRAIIHQCQGTAHHPFHYQELASFSARGTHSAHVIDQSQHPIGLGDFTASIPLLNKIGNQRRLSNSYIVYELTSCIPLPRTIIHECMQVILRHPFQYQEPAPIRGMGASQHPSHYSAKLLTKVDCEILIMFMNSQHPFHYQELAHIHVKGIHSIHPITQQIC